MRAYMAFTKKEFTEVTRNYKLLILGLVFLLFGVMSPITAKYLPEIISKLMPAGMEISIAEPTAMDSWSQFFKNVAQMGLFVLVILFSGMMASEYSKGTLVHLVTKGLNRKTIILSKFTASLLLWTGAYILCFLVTFGYTWFFWGDGTLMKGLAESILGIWFFGVMLLAVVLLGSFLFRNSYGSLLFAGTAVIIQILVNMIPHAQKWNPIELVSKGNALLLGALGGDYLLKPSVTAVLICVICVGGACFVFDKKQL